MKFMPLDEFKNMLSRKDWVNEQTFHQGETSEREIDQWDETSGTFEKVIVPFVGGYCCRVSTLGGIQITYNESFEYDLFQSNSLSTSSEGLDEVWKIDGVSVINEHGLPFGEYDIEDLIPSEFSRVDYSELEIDQVVNVDSVSCQGEEVWTVHNDYGPSLKFVGEILVNVSNDINRFTDELGRKFRLTLYQSQSGKYVCERIGFARWAEESDFHQAKVCASTVEVKEFFGDNPLAKTLYDEAGI